MPNRVHRPRPNWPPTVNHYFAHPVEMSLFGGLWTTLGGILTAAHYLPIGIDPHRVLAPLPAYQAEIVPILLLAAGLGVLAAIFWTGADSTAWSIELAVLPLAFAGWGAYGIGSTSPWWTALAAWMCLAIAGRFSAAVMNRRDPAGVLIVDGQIVTNP